MALRFGVALVLSAGLAQAQSAGNLEKRITEFILPNGLHFLVAERHVSPVISFRTYIKAGSVDTPAGETGLAKLMERMAFKGTETIGTRDWSAEKKALDALEDACNRLEAERNKGPKADDGKIASLEMAVKMAMDQARGFVRPGEFPGAAQEAGATNSSVAADADSFQLAYSLPSNRAELWFLLESQRLQRPVFREFYQERDAQATDLKAGLNANPQARLLAALPAAAFEAHPYRNPLTGWPGDLEQLRTADAKAFFDKYFVPGNITCAIAGDITAADARRLAERYFGPIPARPMPPPVHPAEPPQTGPRSAVVGITAQPYIAIGYKRPDSLDRDDPIFDLLQVILAGDRQSLVYQDLIERRSLISAVQIVPNYPGARFPSLFTFLLRPAGAHTPEEVRTALASVLLRLQTTPVDATALARAKARLRDSVLERMSTNDGLAQVLAAYGAVHGDWHKVLADLDRASRATPADVQRVAIKYFVPEHSTMVSLGPPAKEQQ